MRLSFYPLVCVLLTAAPLALGSTPEPGPLVLQGATVIDGNGGPAVPGRTLVLESGWIVDIYGDGEKPVPASADVRNLEGHYVIPGLIESHVHVGGATDERLTWALQGGVTTMREMAGDGGYLRTLQQAIKQGELDAPDIYCSAIIGGPELIQNDAGVKLAPPPPYLLGVAPWARQVDERSDLPVIVADARACGATGLKLYADLSPGLVRSLTAEAHRQGLRVWAHAVISPATVEDVVDAGVNSISHAISFALPPTWRLGEDIPGAVDARWLNPERMARLAAGMKTHGTFLDPTLAVSYHRGGASSPNAAAAERIEGLCAEVVRQLHRHGVAIVTGTDCALPRAAGEPPAIHRELRLLVEEAGLEPAEAIVAATKNGAVLLGIDRTHGTVEQGKVADLVVLRMDPLTDIEHTTSIAFVVKRGGIVPGAVSH